MLMPSSTAAIMPWMLPPPSRSMKGIESVEENIPHVEHVAVRKVDDAVAVGMAARHVGHGHRFTVEVQRDPVVEGDDGQ